MKRASIFALALVALLACAPNASAAVATRDFGEVRVHTVSSAGGANAVVVEKDRLVVFDAFGNGEDDAAYGEFIASLGKPVDRVFISHADAHHWEGVRTLFPQAEIYSVVADAINRESASPLGALPLDDGALVADGVTYEFASYNDIGAWVIKMPAQKLAMVHHLGYLGVHVPMPPLEARLDILKGLEKEGYTWIIGGHGAAAEASRYVREVAAYYDAVTRAVAANTDPAGAKAAIMAEYPQWGGERLLDMLLPLFYRK